MTTAATPHTSTESTESTESAETPSPSPASVPFRFFDVRVVRTQVLGPSMVRITFGGDTLKDFASGGRDQRFKLFLPHPHQDAPIVPVEAGEEWFPVWRAMDPAVRAVMRSYTVRAQRREPEEVDVDFALHGADPTGADASGGPASRWAARARPGDRAMLLGPVAPDNGGVDFRPPPGTDWVLIAADETALPAVAGILEWLPAGIGARVWIELQHAEDLQQLPTEADAEIVWLVRDGADPADPHSALLLDGVRDATLPEGTPYAWIAGEAGTVRALRRHLVRERGYDRKAVTFTGYWRLGATDDQLIEEAVSGTGPASDDD
ncbi:Siderophore-interacting protein [Streptomyces bingchenggensis BCW-1]|uniref:Siderophore-interacting protein n=1 Tax=Streptomyces bingchenggensis (strain BCW-1) TaxID=749414 RepID=D7BU08_STRBB|nr:MULTISPECIES: siderophore-interacting protein [Streptomyces]ADI09577.1 Siderophore-interacting protein [Streptomyces bingchenggensis BCW-1]